MSTRCAIKGGDRRRPRKFVAARRVGKRVAESKTWPYSENTFSALGNESRVKHGKMAQIRRTFVGLLVIAMTHFGVMATAPAHAHEGDGHGMREIVLAHAHDEAVEQHQGSGDHHDDEAQHSDPSDGALPADEANHGEHAHVHGGPQFAPITDVVVAAPATYSAQTWPALTAPGLSHSSFPPLRPPRAIL